MTQESKNSVENTLKELGKKIDQLIEESKEASLELREELDKTIATLKIKKEALEVIIRDYQERKNFRQAKGHFASALFELKKAFQALFSKRDV
jgi:ribosomal protein L17